jgi:hypothetical protein
LNRAAVPHTFSVPMPALALWTPDDPLLGAVAPLAAGAAAGTALVLDLDPGGPHYPGSGSLADLVADGPRRVDLEPARQGTAVLRNGGIDPSAAWEVVAALTERWPRLVLRLPADGAGREEAAQIAPVVPVRPLLPDPLRTGDRRPAVYQDLGWRSAPSGPGPVLPRPRPGTWSRLLAGRMPPPDRWLRSWRAVWEFPWA